MKEDYFITGEVTYKGAFEMTRRLANDFDKSKPLQISGEDFTSLSILYHAATHHGFTVSHFRIGDDKYPIKEGIIRLAEGNWNFFIKNPEAFESEKDTTPAAKQKAPTQSRKIKTALDELENLTGLIDVKKQIREVSALAKITKERKKQGLPVSPISQHLVLTGNPGTGKTTVARIIGDIYAQMGLLEKGHLIETDGRGLTGRYIGETDKVVRKVVESALGGVLFIDEAYSLASMERKWDYGAEAIATLIKLMEDHREELIVIIAGYDKEMDKLVNSNPGLKSRFKTRIDFPDYGEAELLEIFENMCSGLSYKLTQDANLIAQNLFAKISIERPKNFGNGRTVRNIFEKTLSNQAARLQRSGEFDKRNLTLIWAGDIPKQNDIDW